MVPPKSREDKAADRTRLRALTLMREASEKLSVDFPEWGLGDMGERITTIIALEMLRGATKQIIDRERELLKDEE